MLTEPRRDRRPPDGNDALGYARDLLAPFGFVPLLAPLVTADRLPQFFANALTNANFFYDIRFHYAAIIVAVLALATVEGIAWLRPDELAALRRRLGRRLRAGHVGCVGHLTDRHAVPHRLLAARRQRPPGDARRRRRHRARRRGRVRRLPHRPPPLPPHADLHLPQPVDPGQLGRRRGRPATTRTSTTRPTRSNGSSSTGRRSAPTPARPSSSPRCSSTASSRSSASADGIVVARRVEPPVGQIGPDGLLTE